MAGKRKYELDEYVFDVIDTEEKAYWLGYLYCDGHIGSKGTSAGNLNLLRLDSVDFDIIQKFRVFLKITERPIKNSNRGGGLNRP